MSPYPSILLLALNLHILHSSPFFFNCPIITFAYIKFKSIQFLTVDIFPFYYFANQYETQKQPGKQGGISLQTKCRTNEYFMFIYLVFHNNNVKIMAKSTENTILQLPSTLSVRLAVYRTGSYCVRISV